MNDKPKLQVKFVSPPIMLSTSPKPVNKIVIQDTPKHSGLFLFGAISATVLVTLGFIAGLIWILI